MRRRRGRRWLLPIVLWASLVGRDGPAQTSPLPPAMEEHAGSITPGDGSRRRRIRGAICPDPRLRPRNPSPARRGWGFAVGGMDAQVPQGLPINLATAMQLAGVRPLDIAAATAQVEQALALQLQAKALWIPNINGGVDYFRHDGVQQNIFTGPNFRKGRQSFFVGGGPSLSVGLADAIFAPLAARRVVASRRADLQAARNDVLFAVAQAYFDLQAARGRLLGVGATIVRAELLVNFAKGLAPSLIAPLEINRAQAELQSLRQTQQVAIRDWRVASARLAEVLLLDPATLLEPIEPPFLQVTLVPFRAVSRRADADRPEQPPRDRLAAASWSPRRSSSCARRRSARSCRTWSSPARPRPRGCSRPATSPPARTGRWTPTAPASTSRSPRSGSCRTEGSATSAGSGSGGPSRSVASIELTRTVFRVKSEVSQAVARLQTARVRVVETEEGVRQAIESADKNFIGLRETARPAGELLRLIVRPQEVVAALIALNTAYEQYAAAVSEYNVAQFEVYRALGQPAQWVTSQAGNPPPPAPAPAPPTRHRHRHAAAHRSDRSPTVRRDRREVDRARLFPKCVS